jgi:NAD(P)-dependent dehydrogenase (short-subunit alcohol dehydrogenase family)
MSAGFNPFSLAGKRLLVTGATSGIGRQIAISCTQMGALIVGVGRDEKRLLEMRSKLDGLSAGGHQMLSAELTNSADRESVITALGGQALHGVVHAAGISRLAPIRQLTEKHMREVQSINVEAPMLLTQALLKRNLVQDGGSILFVSSIAAHIGVPGVGVYSGTKAALLALTRCLAMEVAKRRIRANCLSPSLVETPLFDLAMETAGIDSMAQQRANHPLGFGQPDDVANAAIYFLSDASRWVTGTTLIMDGGLTIT